MTGHVDRLSAGMSAATIFSITLIVAGALGAGVRRFVLPNVVLIGQALGIILLIVLAIYLLGYLVEDVPAQVAKWLDGDGGES